MGAAPVWGNEDDIEARGAMRKLGMLTQKDLRGNGDAGLLARHDRIGSLFLSFPALHFDKGQVIATLRDKIDFPALGFVAVSKIR